MHRSPLSNAAIRVTDRPLSNANRISRSNVEVKRLYATVECFAAHRARLPTTPGMLQIYAARIGLSDPNSPVITNGPAGSLLDSAAPLTGEHALRFAVRDAGGGIARVGIVVDDRSVVSRALDPAAPAASSRTSSSRPARRVATRPSR